jgi:membrane protein implicated in regulation of membrane protease activity
VPVVVIIIVGVVLVAIALIGLVWAVLVLVTFYAFVGIAVFLIWRTRRKQAEIAASVQREAERQRLFNEQEQRAWQASLLKQRRNADKRERMLRQFDSTRVPPMNS